MIFENKHAVITGGANGIGRHIAKAFLAEGARVSILDIDDVNGTLFANANENLTFYNCDISQKSNIDEFYEQIDDQNGIDFIINNAAMSSRGILSGCSWEEFERTQRIGVTAPFYISSVALKRGLLKTQASIINIVSTRAKQSQPDTESYSASKGALLSLTHAMSSSFSGYVRVNAISPGWISIPKSDTNEYSTSEESDSDEDHAQHTTGRVGTPKDITEMVLFLCNPEKAGFITGQNLIVDGGMSKLMVYHGDHGWEYRKPE